MTGLNLWEKDKSVFLVKCIVVVVTALIVLLAGNYLSKTWFFAGFHTFLTGLSGLMSEGLGHMWAEKVDFNFSTGQLEYNGQFMSMVMPVGAYVFYFILSLFYIFVPGSRIGAVLVQFVFTTVFLAFRAALISFIMLTQAGTVHYYLLSFLDLLIYLPAFVNLMFVIKNNIQFNLWLNVINTQFESVMKVKVETVVLLLILLPPWPRIILNYIGSETISWITDSILNVSRIIVEWAGKHAFIYDKTILLGLKSISLEQPCLGLGVATIVIILIAVTRSKLLNKLLFIPAFLLFFALMNSFRLAITLLYIQTIPVLSATIRVNIHNTITYFMYVVAFGAFIVYIFWFQNFSFKFLKILRSDN